MIQNTYLNTDAAVSSLSELVGSRGRSDPSPLVGGRGHYVVLLPVVEVPGLAITTNSGFLGTGPNALIVITGTTAHDEDLLSAVQLVDGGADQHVGHGVGDGILVNAGVGEESSSGEVATDISVAVGLAAHQLVVSGREGLQRVHDNAAQNTAQIGGLFESIILAEDSLVQFPDKSQECRNTY